MDVNPLTHFRLTQNQGNGWSLDQCAKELNVSISTIVRTEQGCYNEIPPTILRGIASAFISPADCAAQYSRFQTSKRDRVRNSGTTQRLPVGAIKQVLQKDPDKNPFVAWREALGYKSRLSFCKDLCLHPSTVKRLEDGVAEDMPESVVEVLTYIGVDWSSLEYLYKKWRVSLNDSKTA